jgi:hypothetical protein
MSKAASEECLGATLPIDDKGKETSPISCGAEFARYSELRLSALPIGAGFVILMGPHLPISVLPAVVAKLGHVLQLLLGDDDRAGDHEREVLSQYFSRW